MSVLLMGSTMVGLTSCSDDDTTAPAVDEKEDLTLTADVQRVKIGPENMVLIDVASGNGQYHAFSLNPEIADVVVGDDGQYYIQGFKNGTAQMVISDAASNYKQLTVFVYTTDQLQLSHEDYTMSAVLGKNIISRECTVVLGNGGYSVESNNAMLHAEIDSESGMITIEAIAYKEEFKAVVTVKDCAGLSASINVTVTPSLEPFTQDELDAILAKNRNDLFIEDHQFPYTVAEDFARGLERSGTWSDRSTGNGSHTFGWWCDGWYDAGHYIIYPEGTTIGQEVDAIYRFLYRSSIFYGETTYNLDGKAKILQDDGTKKVMIWWNVDLENEFISRGWIVKMK